MYLLRFALIAACSAMPGLLGAQTNVTTYHNDNARTGQYLTETLLTPANVRPGLFGQRFSYPVDGEIYAQPLYLARVSIAGSGLHDVVFVATAHDSVYAFDADRASGSNAAPLWHVSFLNEADGVSSVPAEDVNCGVIRPELGIIGTPAIDPSAGTLYVIAETKEPGPVYVFRLHALDVTSGAERAGSPVVLQAPGFAPLAHKQRGALLLANGTVYSEWSSHCDHDEYHGWLLANDAATLQPVGIFNSTPEGNGASFWNGGGGPAADVDGSLFLVSANGDFDANSGGFSYGNSVIKLNPASLSLADFFTPFNQEFLDGLDLDLGSSGAVLLPDSAGSAAHPHLMVTAGKEGRLYLLDRDNLGHAQFSGDASALASMPIFSHSVFGSAAWFGGRVYIAGQNEPLQTFPISNAILDSAATMKSSKLAGELGAIPSISASGDRNGMAWIVTSDAALNSFDAGSLSLLFDSSAQPAGALGSFIEFSVPTVANGKVYVGGTDRLVVYGELPQSPPVIEAVTNAASYAQQAVAPGSLITIFGSALSLTTASAPSIPLPISLNDVSVTVNGIPAPLLYVSQSQINAQVPASVPVGSAQTVVWVAGAASPSFRMQVRAAAPGIFSAGGFAAAINQDDSINSMDQPAAPGSIVSIFLTGYGAFDSNNVDGDPVSGQPASLIEPMISADFQGRPASVAYAGPAPGYVGLIQVNLLIPALPAGTHSFVITMDGQSSNAASIYIGENAGRPR